MNRQHSRLRTATLLASLALFATHGLRAQNPAPAQQPPKPAAPAAVPQPLPLATLVPTKQVLQKKDKHRKLSDEFFLGPVVHLEFKFKPEEWEYLKKDNRRYAECELIETAPDG